MYIFCVGCIMCCKLRLSVRIFTSVLLIVMSLCCNFFVVQPFSGTEFRACRVYGTNVFVHGACLTVHQRASFLNSSSSLEVHTASMIAEFRSVCSSLFGHSAGSRRSMLISFRTALCLSISVVCSFTFTIRNGSVVDYFTDIFLVLLNSYPPGMNSLRLKLSR